MQMSCEMDVMTPAAFIESYESLFFNIKITCFYKYGSILFYN